MSKRAEERAREYANTLRPERTAYENFIAGYEQAESDIIERAIKWISNNCYIPHSNLENFRKAMEEDYE